MTEEELKIFNRDLKRVKTVVVILVIIVLFFTLLTCNNNKYQKLKLENKTINQEYISLKNDVKIFEKKRLKKEDSLNTEILKREENSKSLILENVKLNLKYKSVKDKVIVMSKNIDSLTNYYNKRYKTNSNSVVSNKVGLSLTTAHKVAVELEESDKFPVLMSIKKDEINNLKIIINNQTKDKEDINEKFINAIKEIEKREELENSADENIKNLQKQVKVLKTKNIVNKLLLPVALIGGGFLGYQIAK